MWYLLSCPYELFAKKKERNQLFLFNTDTDPIHTTGECVPLFALSLLFVGESRQTNQLEARATQTPEKVRSVEWEHMVSSGSRFLLPMNVASQPHYLHLAQLKQCPPAPAPRCEVGVPGITRGEAARMGASPNLPDDSREDTNRHWRLRQSLEIEGTQGGCLRPHCPLCKLDSLLTPPSVGPRSSASSSAGPLALHRGGLAPGRKLPPGQREHVRASVAVSEAFL